MFLPVPPQGTRLSLPPARSGQPVPGLQELSIPDAEGAPSGLEDMSIPDVQGGLAIPSASEVTTRGSSAPPSARRGKFPPTQIVIPPAPSGLPSAPEHFQTTAPICGEGGGSCLLNCCSTTDCGGTCTNNAPPTMVSSYRTLPSPPPSAAQDSRRSLMSSPPGKRRSTTSVLSDSLSPDRISPDRVLMGRSTSVQESPGAGAVMSRRSSVPSVGSIPLQPAAFIPATVQQAMAAIGYPLVVQQPAVGGTPQVSPQRSPERSPREPEWP